MKPKIDKVGRIILPKPLRERLGLTGGDNLQVEETSEGLMLKPLSEKPSMIKVDGFWVHQGSAPKDLIGHASSTRTERKGHES